MGNGRKGYWIAIGIRGGGGEGYKKGKKEKKKKNHYAVWIVDSQLNDLFSKQKMRKINGKRMKRNEKLTCVFSSLQ